MAKNRKSNAGSGARRSAYVLRQATLQDVDAIVALNYEAYPQLAEDDVVWKPEHVRSHMHHFPEGQLVVECEGEIVASASSLIVNLGRDRYREHTWAGITDNGMFYSHDPYGDTLYGADVNTHPEHRGKGLGKVLYEGRRELCKRFNLKRIVLGGRLYSYCDHAEAMTADEYAKRVEAGELSDLVLSFQLSQGFVLKKVMRNYLKDARSLNYGTFLEWINPVYRRKGGKARAIRVSSVQYRMRKIADFEGFAQQVAYYVDVAAGYDSDFVLFPELLTAQLMSFIKVKTPQEAIRKLTGYTAKLDRLFQGLAGKHQLSIVGGTHPVRIKDDRGERIENIATLYLPDGRTFRQPKIHITPNERRWWGIEGGSSLQIIDTPKARVGILICYDVEFPEAARYLADQGVEVLFVPFCTDDRQAYLRVRYCAQARAVENQLYVVMAGNVGNLPDVENMDIQYAQSAVLSPSDFPFARDGILAQADANTETVITTDLDLEALEEAINEGSVRQRRDRRPDLFRFLATLPPAAGVPSEETAAALRSSSRT